MLVNIHHDSAREHNRLLVAGVVFITVMALLVGLSIAIYQKVFDNVTTITIKADRAGLQLAKFGDVRLNGVLIGQVRKIEQDGKEASIEVALQPSVADGLPENVNVQILPTTLFGQKYISFVMPDQPSSAHLRERRRHPLEPGRGQRRAQPDPRRALPAPARGPAGRPQHGPQRPGHRARGPWRPARRHAGGPRRLPRRHRGAPPDAARGPGPARRGRRHLRRRRTRPARRARQPDRDQQDDHPEVQGDRRLLQRPRRPGQDVHADPGRQRGQPDPGRRGDRARS